VPSASVPPRTANASIMASAFLVRHRRKTGIIICSTAHCALAGCHSFSMIRDLSKPTPHSIRILRATIAKIDAAAAKTGEAAGLLTNMRIAIED
jgi:hypothetical protein